MATYNSVYVITRYANIDNAAKKEPKMDFRSHNGKVYKKVWCGAMRGKIKEYVLANKLSEEHYGENWNGFGYQDKYNIFYFDRVTGLHFVEMTGEKKSPKPAKTWEHVRDTWAKRLVRLLANVNGYEWITMDVAQSIAEEKKDYKQQQIDLLENKQYEHFSQKRAALIRKMKRENPLRRITDESHAVAIIAASRRHNNSNYEYLLDSYRREAAEGIIDRDEVRDMARNNVKFDNN